MKANRWFLVVALLIVGVGFAIGTNLWTSRAAGPEGSIGYVDVANVYDQVFWKLEQVQKIVSPLTKMQEEYNAKIKGLDEKGQEKVRAEIEPRFNAERDKVMEQLKPIDRDFQGVFAQLLNEVLPVVAKREGVTVILDSTSTTGRRLVLYGGKDLSAEVHDEIVKKLMASSPAAPQSGKSSSDSKK